MRNQKYYRPNKVSHYFIIIVHQKSILYLSIEKKDGSQVLKLNQ